jgi:hypothetical protein
MSEVERPNRKEIERRDTPPAVSYQDMRQAYAEHYRTHMRVANGAELSKLIARMGQDLIWETQALGPLGDMILATFVAKAVEVRDKFMDQPWSY